MNNDVTNNQENDKPRMVPVVASVAAIWAGVVFLVAVTVLLLRWLVK
jgi:hypothetical protein